MTFDMNPSPEFARLKAELAKVSKRFLNPDMSVEDCKEASDRMMQIMGVLHHMPEWQYQCELEDEERQAWKQNMAAELSRRGRMVSILSLSPTDRSIDEAIEEGELSESAAPTGMTEPLTVLADMSRMTAEQVARCLRMMAERIDHSGIVVYRGPCPTFWRHVEPGEEWWAAEQADGSLRHSRGR
jgi:hypothetical protein